MDMVIKTSVNSHTIRRIRDLFSVPDEVSDEELASTLVADLSWRYLDPTRWSQDDIDSMVGGILSVKEVAG